jgi:hypothetical protein
LSSIELRDWFFGVKRDARHDVISPGIDPALRRITMLSGRNAAQGDLDAFSAG